jgi:methionine--tRNA ligase beta chain
MNTSDPIDFSTFTQIDMRVGTILDAQLPDWSEKLIELTVDFGEELGKRTIFAGIRAWYQPEDLVNKQSVFVVNLPPRKMGPGISEGMLLAAGGDDNSAPSVLLFDGLASPGDRLH